MSARERQVLAEIERELGRDRRLARRLARGVAPWWRRTGGLAAAAAVLVAVGAAAAVVGATTHVPAMWWVLAVASTAAAGCVVGCALVTYPPSTAERGTGGTGAARSAQGSAKEIRGVLRSRWLHP
ncbi:DUF3040 domain-containing protein [Kitasatospora sp. NBC_01539]|uniref:DUF3040 domain-containing protein n=1 Tax=Kitasatospora sp. NBC_01539 TaxID=2903577 RepID=UPI0038603111